MTLSRPEASSLFQNVQRVLGDIEVARAASPWKTFDDRVCQLLAELSRAIITDRESRSFPDLVSLAYWCRRSNLEAMKNSHVSRDLTVGRGVALHIPPGNVPLNSIYSLVCGLLAGNSNIVRLSSAESSEINMVIAQLVVLLNKPEHSQVSERICLIRYEHDDQVTSSLSISADVRIIWGGDATVSRIRAIPAKPRTVDVSFADRTSVALLEAEEVARLDYSAMGELADRFFVDSYTFGQNACSSPRLVIWHGVGDVVEQARNSFWPVVEEVARSRNSLEPINYVNRFVELCESLAGSDVVSSVQGISSHSLRISLKTESKWVDLSHLRFGTFSEVTIERIDTLEDLLDEKTQTISYFGYSSAEIQTGLMAVGLKGVDRVVPLGQALNFDLVWDGYDLIGFLSRVVVLR